MLLTNPTDELPRVIRALSERIATEVSKWKNSKRLVSDRQKYTLRPSLSRQYSVDSTIRNFPIEEIEEEEWNRSNIDEFLSQTIEPLSEYQELVRALEGHSAEPSLARSFAWRVAYQQAMTPSNANSEQSVQTLVNDISGKGRREYKAKVWLTGIILVTEKLHISDALLLRVPTREDLQEKVAERMVHFAHGFQHSFRFSCIADLRATFSQPVELQREIDRLTTALRLFRLGSVSAPLYEYSSDSFAWPGLSQVGTPARTEWLTYSVGPEDIPKLRRLLRMLMPILPSLYDIPPKDPDFMSTALNWYTETLLGPSPLEGKVASAIACLEALFLGDNPSTEITFRFVQRITSLFRNFGWPPLETRATLSDAYDVRSKYVHGVSLNKKTKKFSSEGLNDLFQRTAECARVACLVWLQLRGNYDRREILSILEKALVDDAIRKELWQLCNRINFARPSYSL